MKTKMNYYIAGRVNIENSLYDNRLVKRYETLEGAQDYLRLEMKRWREDGLKIRANRVDGQIWGAYATNEDELLYEFWIFATPLLLQGSIISCG